MKKYTQPKGIKLTGRQKYYIEIKQLYKFGYSAQEIGRLYQISRQRVHQILKGK
jgi:predicted DNA-binding protein YlxM (UPF0122 family)